MFQNPQNDAKCNHNITMTKRNIQRRLGMVVFERDLATVALHAVDILHLHVPGSGPRVAAHRERR